LPAQGAAKALAITGCARGNLDHGLRRIRRRRRARCGSGGGRNLYRRSPIIETPFQAAGENSTAEKRRRQQKNCLPKQLCHSSDSPNTTSPTKHQRFN
jgi:hypothetical protein